MRWDNGKGGGGKDSKSKKQHKAEALLVRDPLRFAHLFMECVALLGIAKTLGPQSLYVLRHSGASADWLAGRRSRQALKDRGRWRSDASIRRYEKGGRAAEQLSRCSEDLRRYAHQCVLLLPKVLGGSLRPLPPPRPAAW